MYKKILVPIAFEHESDSDGVLKLAQLLRDPGAEIVLVNVIEMLPAYAESYIPPDMPARQNEESQKMLDKFAQQLDGSVKSEILIGNPGTQILEYAEKNSCDCIILLSHKPGLEDYFLGSTAARVVRHSPCSVHVVR